MSSYAIRRISDRICLEHGLSIITPLPFAQRKKRSVYPKRKSIRDSIRSELDRLMEQHPKNLQELLRLLEADGYEIKTAKNISLRGKDQKSFVRLRSLGSGYHQEDLENRIAGRNDTKKETEQPETQASATFDYPENKLSYLIDVEEKIRQGKGKGYVRWAKRFNLKQISQMMCFMQENHISSPKDLADKAAEAADKFDVMSKSIRDCESRLNEISGMKKQIINYVRTREIYADYRKAGYNKKFLEAHREEILLHKAAKEFFNKMQEQKIPKIKELSEEYTKVLDEKRKLYGEYRQIKEKMKQYQIALQIAGEIMNEEVQQEPDQQQDKEVKKPKEH